VQVLVWSPQLLRAAVHLAEGLTAGQEVLPSMELKDYSMQSPNHQLCCNAIQAPISLMDNSSRGEICTLIDGDIATVEAQTMETVSFILIAHTHTY